MTAAQIAYLIACAAAGTGAGIWAELSINPRRKAS